MALTGSHYVYTLYGGSIHTRDDVLLLGAITVHFIAAYMMLVGVFNTKMKITELDGLAHIVRDCEKAGFVLLDDVFVRRAHGVVYAFIVGFALLEIFAIVVFVLLGDYSLDAFRRLCTDTCIFMHGPMSAHYTLLLFLLMHIFRVVLSEIDQTMEDRLEDCNHRNFSAKIRRLHRIYESVYLNYKEIDNFMNPAFLIWWNTCTVINVVCAYVLIKSIMIEEPLELASVFFVLLHYGCALALIIFAIIMEFIANVVSFSCSHCNFPDIK